MAVSRIPSQTNVYPSNNDQESFGQLRNGFRHLIQSIKNGNLDDAQHAFNNLTQTMPGVFQTLSLKLTDDYNAIGQALRARDISGAQRAVVQLQRDLQSVRPANHDPNDQNVAGAQNPESLADSISKSYKHDNIDSQYIGTRINIKV